MATAESIFPKIGNDPLYASEVNTFNPKLIGNVSQQVNVNTSGTTVYTQLGASINYIGTGSLGIYNFMVLQTDVDIDEGTTPTGTYNSRFRISGTAGLDMTTPIKGNTNALRHISLKHVFTSGVITASGGNIGSDYVLTVEGKSNLNNPTHQVQDFIVYGW